MMYSGKDIVIRVIKARCKHFNLSLKEYLSDCLDDIRTAIEPVSGGKFHLINSCNRCFDVHLQ